MNKKGISLIVLILIIVIMTILAGSVIVTVGGNNLFYKAKLAVKRNDVQTMVDNYKSVYDDLVYRNDGDISLITDDDFENKGIINEKYTNFSVNKDGIVYKGNDPDIIAMADEIDKLTVEPPEEE